MNWLDEVKWDAQGLVPVIAQEKGDLNRNGAQIKQRHRGHRQRQCHARPSRRLCCLQFFPTGGKYTSVWTEGVV